MSRLVVLALAIVLSLAAPSTARACSCARTSVPGQPMVNRAWSDRPRVFVGHVLEVEATPTRAPRLTVHFVTEASWRGPMPDTVTLMVRQDAPCAWYTAGGRYLVVADVDPASGVILISAPCDDAFSLTHAGKMLAELGKPNWVAPRVGGRALDAHAFPLGQAHKPRSTAESLVMGVPTDTGIARFEIADWSGPPGRSGGAIYLAPGLYQFRITWKDGKTYESYLSMRCETATLERPCPVYRFLGMLRWPTS